MAAVLLPAAVGLNVAEIVQLPFTARVDGEAGQLLIWAKSPLFVPARAMPVMASGAVPELVRVTDCAPLVVPTSCEPNVSDVGVSVTVGAVPVPDTEMLSGLSVALSVTSTFAARIPAAVGRKLTLIVQVEPAPRLAGQLLVCEKSPALLPARAIPLIDRAALPELVSVTGCEELLVPVC